MHQAERRVAVGDALDLDAHREHVHHLLEREALALHLAPDAVDVLRPAGDLAVDARLVEFTRQVAAHVLDVALALAALGAQPAGDALVVVGLAEAEGEVLEFPLHVPDPEAIGERRVDLAGLERRALLLLERGVLQVPQLHQLLGQAQQHQPHVGGERQQQLAQAFGLGGLQRLTWVPARRDATVRNALQFARQSHGPVTEHGGCPFGVLLDRSEAGHEQPREQQRVVGLQLRQHAGELEAALHVLRRRSDAQQGRGGLHRRRLSVDVELGVFHGVGYDSAT